MAAALVHSLSSHTPVRVISSYVAGELYVTKFLPRMADRFAKTAPKGANMEWRSY